MQNKEYIYPINGILTKTFSVPVRGGIFSFPLSTNNKIGLPKNAKILSIQVTRYDQSGRDDQNNPLSQDAILKGHLSLLDTNSQFLLKRIPLISLRSNDNSQRSQYLLTWFKPINNVNVNWQNSNIIISQGASIDNGTAVEFTVYYTCQPLERKGLDFYFQEFQSGVKNMGLRSAMLYVTPQKDNQQSLKLSLSSQIGIPKNATLIGIQPLIGREKFANASGNTLPVLGAQRSAFLSLKCGNTLLLDKLPYTHIVPKQMGLNYFPLPATEVELIDWEGSEIFISNPVSGIRTNQSFAYILYYICENNNSL